MTKEEYLKYWSDSSKHDLEAARDIFNTGHFDWALYTSHLAVEKILKALWLKNNEEIIPPKTHNLLKLADQSGLKLSDENKKLLLDVTGFNIEARYPDYKFEFYKKCTEEFAKDYLNKIEQFHKCILKKI